MDRSPGARPCRCATPRRPIVVVLVLLAATLVVLGCSAADDEAPALDGVVIDVVAVWRDAEAAAFEQVLAEFEARTGAAVRYTSTEGADIASVLDERLSAGNPPDVAILPQPGLLGSYAERGAILPIDDLVGADVRASYAPEWARLGTVEGDLYAVWFKAANKSLVWYSIGAFEGAGVVPPDDLAGFAEVASAVAASGIPAFAVPTAAEAAWTLTDLFENLYLRLGGPARYDALATHALPWTDPSVEVTLRALVSLLAPPLRAPLPPDTDFPDSVAAVFTPRPTAAMVIEGDFVPGVVADRSSVEIGVDVDVFPFPEQGPGDRFVVGGGDAAVLMRRSGGGEALLRFLASPDAAEVWVPLGGFLSPNEEVDLAAYPDETTRRVARALLDAGGGGFRFDLSDLQPVEFGGTTGVGMGAVLQQLVAGELDVAEAARRLEAAASAAWEDGASGRSTRDG